MVDVIPAERIEKRIFLIRGQKVMLDSDLAKLYEVPTRRLNEQVKRNPKRFPSDFMLQLTPKEAESLRSHFATSNPVRAFVRLRHILATHKDLARKLEELEKKYDDQFKVVFDAIRDLMAPPPLPPKRKIGF